MTEEDKGAYKYCKNCGRVLSPTYEAELCPTCEENQLFDKVRDYIRKNDVTEMQVAEHFGIPQWILLSRYCLYSGKKIGMFFILYNTGSCIFHI